MREFVAKVHQPGYSACTTLIDTGNPDGWSRVVQTLCNLGEVCLTEEWTYPSALASSQPDGITAAPVAMDAEGMRADALRDLLAKWDEKERGAKR